jgi:beta-lactam-binding protein with PASTA domain
MARQRTVRVWVSSGPRAIIVPQLAAQTERTAASVSNRAD